MEIHGGKGARAPELGQGGEGDGLRVKTRHGRNSAEKSLVMTENKILVHGVEGRAVEG